MISLIMKEKGGTPSEIIESVINQKIYDRLAEAEWGPIALPLWGHADPEREWSVLENPHVEANLSDEWIKQLDAMAKEDESDVETAVSYFLIFTMEAMGYHV